MSRFFSLRINSILEELSRREKQTMNLDCCSLYIDKRLEREIFAIKNLIGEFSVAKISLPSLYPANFLPQIMIIIIIRSAVNTMAKAVCTNK